MLISFLSLPLCHFGKNDKGQRVPFSRRGWELQDSDDDDDDKTTTVPRASRPAKPGLAMPLTIAVDDWTTT
jgi:hypothetical protein